MAEAPFGPDEASDADMVLAQFATPSEVTAVPAFQVPPGQPLIYSKIVAVMREVSHVAKSGYNTHFKYNFRGIDAAVNALGPAMRTHGVFAIPRVISMSYRDALTTKDEKTREVTAQVSYTFYAEDGSSVEAIVNGESLDTGDKGTAKAMSVAFRIVLLQTFALPTDEPTTDDNGHYHTRGGTKGMSKFERETGKALLTPPTQEQRDAAGPVVLAAALGQALAFRACILEHDAWDRPVDDETGPTWGELLVGYIAAEVAAVDTAEQGLKLWATLKAADELTRMHGDKAIGVLLQERAAAIKARNAKALDVIMRQIQAAAGQDEMDGPVNDSINNATAQGRITEAEAAELRTVADERRAKLPEMAPVACEPGCAEHAHGAPQGDQAAVEVGHDG